MEVVVRQVSGLGNQLFQYAAGLYYARRYSASLRVAIEPPHKGVSHGYPRPALLSKFRIPEPIKQIGLRDRLLLSQKPELQFALNAWRRLDKVQIYKENFLERHQFLADLPIGKYEINILYHIANAHVTELRSNLQFKDSASGKNLEMLGKIQSSLAPVSLHMRRGDYTLAAEGNIALPIHYYTQAIKAFRDLNDQSTFFVFSDDIAYAKQVLPSDLNAIFVDHNDDFSSHEDLRLMSSCHHHILANSTFSWWGAWLNPREDKIVYAPKQWHVKPESFYPDLLPTDWQTIDLQPKLERSLSLDL
jgi:hypothetical protein